MSKNSMINELEKRCDKLFKSYHSTVSPAMEKQRDEILQEIHITARNIIFTFSVIDMNLQSIIFHETNHPGWMHSEAIIMNDPDNLHDDLKYTHPDDVIMIYWIKLFILQKLKDMPPDRLNDFEIRFFRRMKDWNGNYCYCQQRISVLLYNDSGKIWLLRSLTTHAMLTDSLLDFQVRLIRILPMDLYHGKRKQNNGQPVELTEHQFNILLQYGEGFTINEIAKKTGIGLEAIKKIIQIIKDKTGIEYIKKLGTFAIYLDEKY